MVIQKLSENLRLQFTVTPYIPDPAQEVFTFKPLRVPGALKTGILYGAAPEDLSGREFPAGICIAVAGDPASAESAFAVQKHPDVNFLFISGLTLPDLMSVISDVFMEETRFTTQINRLSVVSSSNAGLQPLIDQAHSVLECPIVVMDSSYRVLAISLGSLAEDHQELSRQQEIGIITERNLKRMKRDRVYEKLRQAPNHMLYTKARDSDIWWVNMLITVHGIEVAETGIQETGRKFSDYDFQYIRFLQQMIALEFQRSNYFETDFGIAHSIFVKELLDHQFISEEMIAQRAHLLGWKSAPYYFIMSVYPDEQAVHPSQKKMEIFVHRILSVLPNCRWRINDENLLEFTFETRGLDVAELMDILHDYRQKRRYHRLKDGTFLTLQDQQLAALSDLVEHTGLQKSDLQEGKAVRPLAQALYLDELAQEDARLEIARSQNFRALVQKIRQPQTAPVPLPAGLTGTLRGYQVTGFNWLSQLAAQHLGGILADDMGLGKTLQVITLLLAQREQAQQEGRELPPSLVVAPTSLVYNWLEEVHRFAPGLQALVIAGSKKERLALLQAGLVQQCDLLLTTYNMLKRDIAAYQAQSFHFVILDEAQHIKNPETQNARAVKKLHAAGWFALTGTPIENTLTELWSLFDFLMPGYLGTHRYFKQHYEIPIVRERETEGAGSENPAVAQRALIDLQRHIRPFILRRLKKDVLTELPDKVETKLLNEMTTKQAKIYKAYFLQSQKEFAQTLKEHGVDGGRMRILAILTRLRQIACDPALFLESWEGGSGKLDQLDELVTDAIEGGHRLLIFSQFTQLLARIRERFTHLGVSSSYLDGSTPAKERLSLVQAFNAGEHEVFLISLKAGGTGLNLTGADMVVHVDPWWNPAVEDQATDRAYRLGQQRKVQVVQLITKDTVEEKIYQLQAKKKALIDQMIQPGGGGISQLTEEELRSLFQ